MRNEKVIAAVTACFLVFSIISINLPVGQAQLSRSVYLVADHHASPTPINAYGINDADGTVTYQSTYYVQSHALGASGLAMYNDPNGDGYFKDALIFVTYESSNLVEVFNAIDLTTNGTIPASGASDLAGIVVDQEKELIYTVDRYTKNLYVYDANTFAPVGALPIVLSTLGDYGAVGLDLDETNDLLFVTDFDPIVHYFDTNSWMEVGTIITLNPFAIGIAYDEKLQLVYTGGAFYGDCILSKYDMTTATATSVDVQVVSGIPGCGAMGLAVDQLKHRLYVTTGYYGDDLRAFDSDLNPLPGIDPYPDPEGMILNPAGIVIEAGGFNPLNLEKDDGLAEGECVSPRGTIDYSICFDNMRNTFPVHNVTLVDDLSVNTTFVSASDGGTYNPIAHTVTWIIPVLQPNESRCLSLEVTVKADATPNSTMTNKVTINAAEPGTGPSWVYENTTVCPTIPVYIDVKPASWPNPVQLKDRGVLPVAVCGTEDFDVATVDPETIRLTLEGVAEGVPPLRWSYEDVATPWTGEPCSGHDLDGDGYLDLTLKFKAQEVIETLGLDAFSDGDMVILILTGNLKEEHGGTPIQGQDCIVIRHK